MTKPNPPATTPEVFLSRNSKAYFPRRIAAVIVVAGLAALCGSFSGSFEQSNGHFGIWSVVPPFAAIAIAFITHNVIVALFIGIFLGGMIAGKINIVTHYLIPGIGSKEYGLILLVYLWALGGLIGLWTRTGGAAYFAQWASRRMVRGPRTAKFFAWCMGLVFHQGGTISSVLTGATVRPVADEHKVSHEELSFIVDATASPAATLIPFNVWPIYIGGLIAGTIPIVSTSHDGIALFFRAIPLNFYAILTILFTFLLAWDKLPLWPFRRMREAVHRARSTGQLDRPGAQTLASPELSELRVDAGYKPGLIDFVGPIGTLLGVAIVPYMFATFVLEWKTDSPPPLLIAEAFVLAVLVAIGIAVAKGMPLAVAMKGFVEGCRGVTIGAIILGLAITLKTVADDMGTAAYVGSFASGLSPSIIPAIFMLMCMVIAFSTGTSFGTFAIFLPIAMPLAWEIQPDPFFMSVAFSAVIGGSLFGDQCSPISDTTILSSVGTGADVMDHVHSQIPIALTAAILSACLYTGMIAIWY